MQIKFKKLSDTAIEPKQMTAGAAGYDLYVDTEQVTVIHPRETRMFQTNIAMEIPEGYFGAIFPRSGLSTKKGIVLANCVGVIDSDYRGSIGLPLHNRTDAYNAIEPHERVAQLVILPYAKAEFIEDDLSDTERGAGGFGSSGVK